MVKYDYTAYGECMSVTGSMANTIGQYNHMKYKGYYFDEETGFFYCLSRYYVPEWCRFLNADHIAFAEQSSSVGMNLFAYCCNNPVMYVDYSGNAPKWQTVLKISLGVAIIAGMIALSVATYGTASVIFAGAAIGATAGGIGAGISTAVSGGTVDDFADSFLIGTTTGAISGAVAASPLGIGGQMLVNTVTSTLNYVGTQHLSNKDVTLGGVVCNAAAGTLSGWIGGNGWMQSQKTGAFIAFKGQNALKHVFGMVGTKSLSKMILPAIAVGGIGGGIYGRASEKFNENGMFIGF